MFTVVLIHSIGNCKLSVKLMTLIITIGVISFSVVGKADQKCISSAFAVQNASIDEIADTGTLAREYGISKASVYSFKRVLERLLLSEEDVHLIVSKVEPTDYLDYLHIHKETTLARRYLGEIDFCFDAREMRRLFRNNGLSWAELVSPPILTMPIWKEASGAVVWNKNNNWLNSWSEHSKTYDGLLSFVSINPNIKTQRQLKEEAIFAENPDVLQIAIQAVNASQLLIVSAEIDHYATIPILRFSSRLFDENAKLIATLMREAHELNGTKNLAVLFEEFQYSLISELEKFWKQKNQISPQTDFALIAQVPVGSLSDWRKLKDILSSMPIVRQINPISLSDSAGNIRITISGNVPQFMTNLNSLGYNLIEKQDIFLLSKK